MKKILALSVAMVIGQMLAISAHAQAIGVDDKTAARRTLKLTLDKYKEGLDTFDLRVARQVLYGYDRRDDVAPDR